MTAVPDLAAWLREVVLERKTAAEKAARADGRHGGRAHWSARYGTIITDEGDPDWAVAGLTPFAADRGTGEHIALNDPADTIARCEAELGILDLYEATVAVLEPLQAISEGRAAREARSRGYEAARWRLEALKPVVRLLGSGYRHRDGYLEEWAP